MARVGHALLDGPPSRTRPLLGAGVHDGLSGLLATRHGFSFLWLSSFGMSAAQGLPDAGLLEPNDLRAFVQSLRRGTSLPLVVDADAGYGDPVKVHQVTSDLARLGAAAICIEDNPLQKRSSLYEGYARRLASIDEQSLRIRAARLASDEGPGSIAVISRTEALVAGLGIPEALERSHASLEAGADAIFVQSVDPTGDDVKDFCRKWGGRCAVFVTPTRYSQLTNQDLFQAGATHIVFANYAIRAAHRAIDETFARLRDADSGETIEGSVSSVEDVSLLVNDFKAIERALDVRPSGERLYAVDPLSEVGRTGGNGSARMSPVEGRRA